MALRHPSGMVKNAIPILPSANTFVAGGLSLIEPKNRICVRAVTGWFAAWRRMPVWVTQLVSCGLLWLLWLLWNERQAVLFDLGRQRIFLLDPALYRQDPIHLAVLLTLAASLLFFVAGRKNPSVGPSHCRRDDLHRATWCHAIVRASEPSPHVQLLNHAATR
jgi:hypothetical protein